jgi:hypothetical protein
LSGQSGEKRKWAGNSDNDETTIPVGLRVPVLGLVADDWAGKSRWLPSVTMWRRLQTARTIELLYPDKSWIGRATPRLRIWLLGLVKMPSADSEAKGIKSAGHRRRMPRCEVVLAGPTAYNCSSYGHFFVTAVIAEAL